MTFGQVLKYLQGPQIGVVIGGVLSVVAEYWPWYQALEKKAKRVCFAALCLIIPVIAAAGACALGYQSCGWEDTIWPAIYQGGAVAFGVGTAVIHNFAFAGRGKQNYMPT